MKELAPGGVDVFFDNVGGELLDTVLRRLALHARVVLCGDISTYNSDEPPPPLRNLRYLMGKRARMEGFNTLDHWDEYATAAADLARAGRRRLAEVPLRRARRLGTRPGSARALVRGRPPGQAGGSSDERRGQHVSDTDIWAMIDAERCRLAATSSSR